jgi:cysteinyl-tRNA synthetase
MGKSYNNVIKLTELFTGEHPLLTKAFSPMTVRFFILQSHYRSTLDFSSEALEASEKAYKRLWEAYETLMSLKISEEELQEDEQLKNKIVNNLSELEGFMNDDLATPKVLANLFDLTGTINSLKDGNISMYSISQETLALMQTTFKMYLEDILGLKTEKTGNQQLLGGVIEVLIGLRKEAKANKDFVTSDRIRNELQQLGVVLKDEKNGSMSWSTV